MGLSDQQRYHLHDEIVKRAISARLANHIDRLQDNLPHAIRASLPKPECKTARAEIDAHVGALLRMGWPEGLAHPPILDWLATAVRLAEVAPHGRRLGEIHKTICDAYGCHDALLSDYADDEEDDPSGDELDIDDLSEDDLDGDEPKISEWFFFEYLDLEPGELAFSEPLELLGDEVVLRIKLESDEPVTIGLISERDYGKWYRAFFKGDVLERCEWLREEESFILGELERIDLPESDEEWRVVIKNVGDEESRVDTEIGIL